MNPPDEQEGPMKYKLIAIDIDGTLLDSSRKLPQEHIDAMLRAEAAGCIVLLATGRPFRAARWVFEKSGLQDGLILSMGGARVTRFSTNEDVYSAVIPRDVTDELVDFVHERQAMGEDLCLQFMVGEDVLVEEHNHWTDFTEVYFRFPQVACDLKAYEGVVNKGNVLMPPGLENEVCARLHELFGERVTAQVSDESLIDLTPPGINKAATIRNLAHGWGIEPEEIIAVGDADSDISMIRMAGLGVCLANGTKNTLAAADYIAPSNDEFGVAHVINKFICGQER